MDITTKTKRMVEKGLVLDERGKWVYIIDKRTKERDFMNRLESGEVLYGKKWVTINEAKAAIVAAGELNKDIIKDNNSEIVIDPVVAPVLEKHVEIELQDENEIAETNEIPVQPIQFKTEETSGKPKKPHLNFDDLFYDHSENETVVMNFNQLSPNDLPQLDDDEIITLKKAMAKSKVASLPIHEDIKELLQSFDEFDVWERTAKKRQAVFLAIATGIAAVIGCSAIFFLLFL